MIRIPTTAWRARGKTLALVLVLAASLAVFVAAGRAQAVPVVFVVNSTGDGADANTADGVCQTATAGECTLRAAIQQANVNASSTEVDTINFAIPTTDPNCDATSGVCTISPAFGLPAVSGAVTIDGYSQPGAAPNSLPTGSNAQLKIELNGTDAGVSTIAITAPDTTVKGLVINRFIGNYGIVVSDDGGVRIEGNYIGTDASGTQGLGNGGGVLIDDTADNVVGGTSAGARNLISANKSAGVVVASSASDRRATNNRIVGNYIGTDASGNGDLGNERDGVVINNAYNNVVGGTSAGTRNLISGNGSDGVVLDFDATGNRILRNSIYDNGQEGIDLGDNGRTANETFTLQFFSGLAADPSGFGEGETFVGQTNVTTNAGGTVAFEYTTSAPVSGGRVVTATATAITTDDTSEFSRAVEVDDNTLPPPAPRCSDGLDNDADGQTDFPADTNCSSATDDSEAPDPPASCTIVGTTGDDDLTGASGADTICGLSGRDTISADAGNDTVRGGPGGDAIQGRSGSDTLQGGDGADTVRGGAGDDDLSGEAGPDGLYGEAGDDALDARDGVRGNDTSNGGSGTDTCSSDVRDGEERCET